MKNIELTEDHKSKLLEMFKKLFPKYNIDEDETYIDDNGMINYLIETEEDCYNGIKIHWLEFCLYYLVDKVFNEDKEESYISNQDYYMGGLIYRNKSQNPIDILYEEFKKLK